MTDQVDDAVSELLPPIHQSRVDEICQTYTAHHKPDQEKLALAQEVQRLRRAAADAAEAQVGRVASTIKRKLRETEYRSDTVTYEEIARAAIAAINPPTGA